MVPGKLNNQGQKGKTENKLFLTNTQKLAQNGSKTNILAKL